MKRVLIIEDNEDNLYLTRYILEKNKLKVITATTGYQGLELARSQPPDMILMDIQLPDINGMEVTRIMRADKVLDRIPIIAITSYAMAGDRQKALDAGCDGYIEKPINPETFLEAIMKYM